jgi:hypothetical protein
MNHGLSIRRRLLLAFIAFIGLIVITLIGFWPFVFEKLSHVDQFYGTISMLVSSLALVGVAISLLHQARAGHTAREQAIRSLQQQLIKMEMDDPILMTAIGTPWGSAHSCRERENPRSSIHSHVGHFLGRELRGWRAERGGCKRGSEIRAVQQQRGAGILGSGQRKSTKYE